MLGTSCSQKKIYLQTSNIFNSLLIVLNNLTISCKFFSNIDRMNNHFMTCHRGILVLVSFPKVR